MTVQHVRSVRQVPGDKAREALATLPGPTVSVHKNTLSDWFTSGARRAKVGGSLHRLRDTFCTYVVMAGTPLRRVQVPAGHGDQATTEKYYAHLGSDKD